LAQCVKRLNENSDFKKLVKDGFINGFSQLKVLECSNDLPDTTDWVQIKAPYVLFDYLNTIEQEGYQAQSDLEALHEELISSHRD